MTLTSRPIQTICAIALNLVVPGAGLIAQGRLRWAIYTQLALILTVALLCWSRLVFEPLAIQVSISLFVLVYFTSLLLCFKAEPAATVNRSELAIRVVAFISVGLTIWYGGLAFKQQWLGFEVFFVPSNSMSPTLHEGDFFIGDTWLPAIRSARSGEIVVFQDNNHLFIKRIFAVAGEDVFQRGVRVSKSENLNGATSTNIGADEVFVVGDNPSESKDSRHFGAISVDAIIARARLKVFKIDSDSVDFSNFGEKL